ncbi:MAG: hypothetical protein WC529_01475 [Candidatus Margulisiibacteriota bacterium]
MRPFLPVLFLLAVVGTAAALSPLDHENNPEFAEQYRIKIWNSAGGTIEVSPDKGKSWRQVGRVIYPSARTNSDAYAAAAWVPDGKVAATAVNAIHLKVSAEADGRGVIFSLLPRELPVKPPGYRSYFNPTSSIYTDIPAGTAIFGGAYAPYVGNIILLSRPGYAIVAWPTGYPPQVDDKIYILVDKPVDYPKEIVLENKKDGAVTITYFNGSARTIGRVVRPVAGVGRFEGTKYASVGRIRANHAGVIDVSTSRLGAIGGFQIVPAQHGANLKYPLASSQWLVLGPADASGEAYEGRAPFFKYFIRPAYGPEDLSAEAWEEKLLDRFLVEVKLKGSDKWQPLTEWEFDDYFLTGPVPNWANNALREITAIRILFPLAPQ